MPEPTDLLESMGMAVPAAANRIASFTNKAAAYYYAQTHAPTHSEYSWYEGLNVAKNRVFGGYDLFVDGQRLDNHTADVTVYPQKLVRRHGLLEEQLWLFDERNLLEVDLTGATQPVGIQLRGDNVAFLHEQDGIAFFSAQEGDFRIAVAARGARSIQMQDQRVVAAGNGFLLAVGKEEAEAAALIEEGRHDGATLKLAREQRLRQYLLTTTYLTTNNDALTQALRWLAITTDQLVTRQQGDGIYAGLPWFNEYWGRDEFISLPGAVLVTGQFATARQILLSFAEYQQLDKESKYYGRVPNIVNPITIDYHTTDGTPRFIIALRNYVQYSGDTALIKQLYPNVEASILGSLHNWVNTEGYLLHADNETWMDARDANQVAYTPRGSCANDIQALWYEQLLAGAYFAAYMHDTAHEQQWTQLAQQVKAHFARDFRDPQQAYLADRLDAQGHADFTLRPNQLFALPLLDDQDFTRQVLRTTWQELVYPWGVATLNRQDPRFHPYHLVPALYPKDAAYHQGTVWAWLNGVAMQRMLEAGQTETAYQLFAHANQMALTRGVVGGLSENLDAYPQPGQPWPRQTGAYLQAWSNAEQLRVWYQYFLGIRPDVPNHQLTLAPRLPAAIGQLSYRFAVGPGLVDATYQAAPTPTYSYSFAELTINAVVDVFPFAPLPVAVQPGSVLQVTAAPQQLTLQLHDTASGQLLSEQTATPSPPRLAEQQQNDAVLAGVPFAYPLDLRNHPVISQAEARIENPE